MKTEALRIAELQSRTELTSQCLNLLSDPLWSTIAGFVIVHELRRRNYVGSIADDILYAGIIAINTGRTPFLADLAGKGLSALATAAGAGAGGVIAAKAVSAKPSILPKVAKGKTAITNALRKATNVAAITATPSTITVIPPYAFSEKVVGSAKKPKYPWNASFWKSLFGLG